MELDDIPQNKRAMAEPVIAVFGEETAKKFFSKNWKFRE